MERQHTFSRYRGPVFIWKFLNLIFVGKTSAHRFVPTRCLWIRPSWSDATFRVGSSTSMWGSEGSKWCSMNVSISLPYNLWSCLHRQYSTMYSHSSWSTLQGDFKGVSEYLWSEALLIFIIFMICPLTIKSTDTAVCTLSFCTVMIYDVFYIDSTIEMCDICSYKTGCKDARDFLSLVS